MEARRLFRYNHAERKRTLSLHLRINRYAMATAAKGQNTSATDGKVGGRYKTVGLASSLKAPRAGPAANTSRRCQDQPYRRSFWPQAGTMTTLVSE